ncbi:hypothetical protein KY342_06130 [Candidatus Woesearchaeota archaeon]|nr:hypothetical protein [Candidatus Woesearchaeota archaeon]
MKLRNKKAIALSVNMLVIIILAVVIFSFGVYFLYSIMSQSFKLKGMIDQDLDDQIETILCDKPVCMTTNYKKIFRGEYEIFGLRIYNNLGTTKNFKITMNPADPKGYDKQGDELTEDDPDLFYSLGVDIEQRVLELGASRERGIGIGIEVPKNAKSGTYVFNINVEVIEDNRLYGSPQQIRVEVP